MNPTSELPIKHIMIREFPANNQRRLIFYVLAGFREGSVHIYNRLSFDYHHLDNELETVEMVRSDENVLALLETKLEEAAKAGGFFSGAVFSALQKEPDKRMCTLRLTHAYYYLY